MERTYVLVVKGGADDVSVALETRLEGLVEGENVGSRRGGVGR
jgi:hypothetical protein